MSCIVEKCKNCESYEKGGCYYGPTWIIKIFGPMYNVPKNGWCNRFNEKIRKNMTKQIQQNTEPKCKNCVGFDACACYRRLWLMLYFFGPKFVNPNDSCWKFKSKSQKTR